MKMLKKYYILFRKHRRDEINREIYRIVRSEIAINAIKQNALFNQEPIITNEKRKEKIIVSLTTHGIRISSAYLAIESIAQQTMKPDEIVLWLSENDFSNNSLPITLKKLIARGLKIKYCKDVGSHTKLLYTLKQYPNDIIITIDDDILYPFDLIENLYKTYLENPKSICCNVARKISLDNNKRIIPYIKWKIISTKSMSSRNLLPLGVNGVLYFPKCFDNEVFDINSFSQLCPKADDIWFRMMSLKNNVNISITGSYPNPSYDFIPLDSSFIDALAISNLLKGVNDSQLKNVMECYNLSIDSE